jgi:hypothetical protein
MTTRSRRQVTEFIAATVLAGFSASNSVSAQNRVNFDPALSRVFVTVHVANDQQTIVLPVVGGVTAEWAQSEGLLRLRDVSFNVTGPGASQFWLNVPVPPAGDLSVHIAGFSCAQAPAGAFSLPASVGGAGDWAMAALPIAIAGSVSYTGEGLVCQRLTINGAPCQFSAPLAAAGAFDSAISQGTLTALPGGGLQLAGRLVQTRPLAPSNLAAGTITVQLFFSGATESCAADFDENQTVEADDIFAFLDTWFAQSGAAGAGLAADINADNTVSADDIFAFLDLWFGMCG